MGTRRSFTDEFKREAVQMLLDGHSAVSIAEQLDIPDANMLYRWRATLTREAGTVGEALDARVKALRQKSRFMNLAATLHWATALLWHLRHFESQSRSGIAAKRFQGQFGWLREFATCLPDWMACQAVMGRALTFIGQAGIYRGAAREFARRAKGLATGGASRELVERTRWFLKSQEKGLRKHERLPLSTEVLESAFASYKQMICQHAKEGISTLLLALPTLIRETTPSEVTRCLEQVQVADVLAWGQINLPDRYQVRRAKMFGEARAGASLSPQSATANSLAS